MENPVERLASRPNAAGGRSFGGSTPALPHKRCCLGAWVIRNQGSSARVLKNTAPHRQRCHSESDLLILGRSLAQAHGQASAARLAPSTQQSFPHAWILFRTCS